MTANVRWSRDLETIEVRCEDCALASRAAWWPATAEFWDFARGFARCRACHVTRNRERVRRMRLDPDYRAREREYARDTYASMTRSERRARYAKRREYHVGWMRDYRARKKAA